MRKTFLLMILTSFSFFAIAQSFTEKFYFPDQNLRQYFFENYPQCFDRFSDSTYKDCIVPTNLNLSELGISDLYGMQNVDYTFLDRIDLSKNYITNANAVLDNLSYYQTKWIDISNNRISGDLKLHSDISYLNCSENNIGPNLNAIRIATLIANNNSIKHVSVDLLAPGKWDLRNNLIEGEDINVLYTVEKKLDTLLIKDNNLNGDCVDFFPFAKYIDDMCVVCPKLRVHGRIWEDINKNDQYDPGEDLETDYGYIILDSSIRGFDSNRYYEGIIPLGGLYNKEFTKYYRESENTKYILQGYSPIGRFDYYQFESKPFSFTKSCNGLNDFEIDQKVTPTSPIDATVRLSLSGSARPGGKFGQRIMIYDNTYPINVSGKIELKFDKRLDVIGSSLHASNIPLISQNDSVIVFAYNYVTGVLGNYIYFDFHVPDSLLLDLNDSLFTTATIYPDRINRDRDTSNNSFTYGVPVRMSYDPNEKAVFPPSNISPEFISERQNLTYTILFQNIGNAEAINIRIKDTLSQNLDISSLDVYETSHSGFTFDLNDNIATWTFKNINLPDSGTNEPASHGFVKYRIKPKATLRAGDQIRNTANIYFDFNPAVVTNTTITKIVDPIVTESETLDSEFETVKVFPNPSKELLNIRVNEVMTGSTFELLEISGQTILKQAIKNNQTQIDISDLKAGTYLYRFTTNNGVKVGKIVKQ
jgi:uncharacterized repeat protein (TIGR01451 family)